MQVINSYIKMLQKLVLRNMAVNVLVDVVIGAKAIPQEVVLLLATPPKVLKTKNLEGLHVKKQLTPLRKVSLLVSIVVHSVTNNVLKECREEYAKFIFSWPLPKLCFVTYNHFQSTE